MSARILLFFVTTIAALITSCGRRDSLTPVSENVADALNLFQAKQGIWLPDHTKRMLGIEIQEVGEQPMLERLRKTTQVFQNTSEATTSRAMVRLSADEALKVRPGHPVTLSTGNQSFVGKLAYLDQQTLSLLGHVEALIEFVAAEHQIAVGTVLEATFDLGKESAVLAIPANALIVAADGAFVYAVNGEHLTRTRVKTGTVTKDFVEIVDGLYPGDRIAVKGTESLWLIELSALKGGKPCCVVPKKQASAK